MFRLISRFRSLVGSEDDLNPQESYGQWEDTRPCFEDTDLNTEDLGELFSNERRNIMITVLSQAERNGETV